MEKLKKILEICKCSVSIEVNKHKDYYEKINDYLADNERYEDTTEEICKEIVNRDSIVEIWMYEHTPLGHHKVVHYDLELAIDEALSCLQAEEGDF